MGGLQARDGRIAGLVGEKTTGLLATLVAKSRQVEWVHPVKQGSLRDVASQTNFEAASGDTVGFRALDKSFRAESQVLH